MTIEGIIGIVLFVIGLPITFWLGRRNRQRPDLRYASNFDEVLAPDASLLAGGLSLSFDESKISRLCRTQIALWNHRGDAIRSDDISGKDPLRIHVSEGDKILQVRVLARSRPQTDFSIGSTVGLDNSREFRFDFLDAGDGVVIEVLHEQQQPAKILGTLRGGTLRYVGRADLGPDARDLIRASILRRYRMTRNARRFAFDVATITYLGFTAWTLISLAAKLLRGTAIVSTDDFNLETIDGQIAFAREVNRSSPEITEQFTFWGLAIGVSFLAVLLLIAFLRALTSKVPRSVLLEELQQEAQTASSIVIANSNFKRRNELVLSVGDHVRHVDFGRGEVAKVSASNGNQVATVNFPNVGPKRLLVQLAPIERES